MTSLSTTLLVIDETDCRETDVFALVALVVPIEKVDSIRLSFHRFVRELQGVPQQTIAAPPELHGSKMLLGDAAAWATDEHRIRCYAHVVELVRSHALEIIRVAYFKKSLAQIPLDHEKDRKRVTYGLCFGGLEQSVAGLLRESYVIPMMDGLDASITQAFGGARPILHALRAAPFFKRNMLGFEMAHLLDPVFVDSRHSSIMQVADVVAYLLHLLDWKRAKRPMTEYKARAATVAETLDFSRIHDPGPIWMNVSE